LAHFKDKVGNNLEDKIILRKNIIKKVEEFNDVALIKEMF
jgi:hypothetical protein